MGAEGWDVTGVVNGFRASAAAITAAAEKAAKDVALYVLAESNQQVPYQDGDLQDSGEILVGEGGNRRIVTVRYTMPYAVRQHEDLTYRHDNGRKAKYLEDPMNAAATSGKAASLIRKRMKEAM